MFKRLFLFWSPSFPETTNQGKGVLSSVVSRDKKRIGYYRMAIEVETAYNNLHPN